MKKRTWLPAATSIVLYLAAPGARPAAAGGFSFGDQGAKAMGMAGAFVAQADDPSAVFYNLAGLALADDKIGALGTAVHSLNESLYQGLPPGIGAGTTGAQDDAMSFLPHVYFATPLSDNVKLGLGLTSPFFFDTDWLDPGSFAGRYLTSSAELTTYDLTAGVAFKASATFGLGVGAVYRTAELQQSRRLGTTDPFSGSEIDAGTIDVDTDSSDGVGFHVGLLHRPSPRFSWGIAYRSSIEVDFDGTGRLTQISTGNDQLDRTIAATFPFDQDLALATAIEFPDLASLGVAFGLTDSLLLEIDAELTGWSSVRQLEVAFATLPAVDQTVRLDFDDSTTLRAGLQYTAASAAQYRIGVAFDESPQPDATVGAWLADKESLRVSVGFGKDWLDVAFTWIDDQQRIVSDQVDDLNGNYRSNAWILGLTLSM